MPGDDLENFELDSRIRHLDPTLHDPAPVVGSARYDSLKEHVMQPTHTPNPNEIPSTKGRRNRSVRRSAVSAAAALVALLGLIGTLLFVTAAPGSAATVKSAAANTADVNSFRVLLETEGFDFLPNGWATGEVNGSDMHFTAEPLELIRVGNVEWEGENGEYVEINDGPQDVMLFAEASALVISAALTSGEVSDDGEEAVNGIMTQRYSIAVDAASQAALAALPESAQFWFTGEVDEDIDAVTGETDVVSRSGYLDNAQTIEVWIADDLVHRIRADFGDQSTTHTFSDFGADITIEPPV